MINLILFWPSVFILVHFCLFLLVHVELADKPVAEGGCPKPPSKEKSVEKSEEESGEESEEESEEETGEESSTSSESGEVSDTESIDCT